VSLLDAVRKAVEEDPIGGSILIDEIVYSVLADEAEQVRPAVEKMLSVFMAERVGVAKRALGRAYVETMANGEYPDPEVQKNAEWIAGIERFIASDISKADDRTFDERLHPRGSGGRFSVKAPPAAEVKAGAYVGYAAAQHKSKHSASTQTHVMHDGKKNVYAEGIHPDTQELVDQHQYQWDAANQQANSIMESFGRDAGKINLRITVQNKHNDKLRDIVVPGSEAKGGLPSDSAWSINDDYKSMSVDAANLDNPADQILIDNKVNAYNVMGNAGGPALAELGTIDSSRYTKLGQTMDRGYMRSQDKSKMGTFFDRLHAGGGILRETPGMEKYGRFAQFVGQTGPEAEKYLGPYAQQAAYRYRGTEKEPDLDLVSQFNSVTMNAVNAVATNPNNTLAMNHLENEVSGQGEKDVVATSAVYEMNHLKRTRGGEYTPDELALNVRADVAARHLLNTLPSDPFVADLSRAAGNVLPSQGVIIDADGDVVSQSVGFSDDHYLPFDLKNLKSLRGGQYVRTRQQGGLTAEDVYASIRTGARMATVVSSSGVFSLEFDPNFRGARANSDKARQMVDRYVSILDAVQNSNLYTQDIDQREKERLRGMANSMGSTPKERKDLFEHYVDQARTAGATLNEQDLQMLHEDAIKQVDSEGFKYKNERYNRRVNEVFDELAEQKRAARVSRLNLNSKGYDAALQTLQQQFPYFIRSVKYQPLTADKNGQRGFLQSLGQSGAAGARQKLGAKDQGYVNAGAGDLRPNVGYKEPKEEKTEAGAAPKEEKVSATPSAGATPETKAKPVPKAKFLGDLEAFTAVADKEASKDVEELASMFRSHDPTIQGIPGTTEWSVAKGAFETTGDKRLAAKYLLAASNNGEHDALVKAYKSDPAVVGAVLSDEKAVKEALAALYGSAWKGESEASFGMSLEDLQNNVHYVADKINDSASLKSPYAPAAHGPAGLFYSGDKPQEMAELASVNDKAGLKAMINANPAVAEIASDLDGLDNTQMSKLVAERVAVLKKAKDARIGELFSSEAAIDPDKAADKALSKAGITPDEWKDAMGSSTSSHFGTFQQFLPETIDQRAQATQAAWGAIYTSQLMDKLEELKASSAEAGGVEAPKAEPPAGELAKSQQGYSSRQVLIAKNHWLAQEVAVRREAGLPLVPIRQK